MHRLDRAAGAARHREDDSNAVADELRETIGSPSTVAEPRTTPEGSQSPTEGDGRRTLSGNRAAGL
jgi:hypothetical protein